MSELRPHSRELLEAARLERTPSAADRERVFRALTAGVAITGAVTSAAAAPALSKLGAGLAKWWLLLGLSSALVGGAYLARRQQPVAVVNRHQLSAPQAASPVATPSAGPVSAEQRSLPATPKLAATASAKSRSAHATLEEELLQLHAAQTAYRDGNAARALSLIAQHEQRFPHSQLGGERAVLKVLALCQAGQAPLARTLAARLRSTARSSAALAGLENSCASATAK